MLNQAFKTISDKVGEALAPQGFKKAPVGKTDENELVTLYLSENLAYTVVYYKDKQHFVMRECGMTDDGPDNEWKTLATWIFNPEVDTLKEANSIANDFIDAVSAPAAVKKVTQAKRKKAKKEDEGNADPLFFSKRMMKLFPELRDEIRIEQDSYESFRGVTFTREHIVPRVNELMKRGNKGEYKKLFDILSAQYNAGDADTRSIITIVVLNSIPSEYDDRMFEYMSKDLQTAFKCAKRYRGKTVRPEKPKKKRKTMAQRLGEMQR